MTDEKPKVPIVRQIMLTQAEYDCLMASMAVVTALLQHKSVVIGLLGVAVAGKEAFESVTDKLINAVSDKECDQMKKDAKHYLNMELPDIRRKDA